MTHIVLLALTPKTGGRRVPRRSLTRPVVVAAALGIAWSLAAFDLGHAAGACLLLVGLAAAGIALFLTGLIPSAQSFRLDGKIPAGRGSM